MIEKQGRSFVGRMFAEFVYWASGEWMLRRCANGGDIIVARSALVSLLIVSGGEIARSALHEDAVWLTIDPARVREAISHALPWFGASFAATYAALYARFSSQWSYLAGLYNQIMASAMQMNPESPHAAEVLAKWQAGFIEDAEALHLARKKMFAFAILQMADDKNVRSWYESSSSNGAAGLEKLVAQIRESIGTPKIEQ